MRVVNVRGDRTRLILGSRLTRDDGGIDLFARFAGSGNRLKRLSKPSVGFQGLHDRTAGDLAYDFVRVVLKLVVFTAYLRSATRDGVGSTYPFSRQSARITMNPEG